MEVNTYTMRVGPQQLLVMEEGGHEDTTKKNQELLTFGQDLELLIKYKYELK
jgi:hypothetical protein